MKSMKRQQWGMCYATIVISVILITTVVYISYNPLYEYRVLAFKPTPTSKPVPNTVECPSGSHLEGDTCIKDISNATLPNEIFIVEMNGHNEVPPIKSRATGDGTFKVIGNMMEYEINSTGISDATGAHVHFAKKGVNGDVVVDLLKNSQNNPTKFGISIRGNISDSSLVGPLEGKDIASLISLMRIDEMYVNIHTEKHPKGEIRGQILSRAMESGLD